MLLRILLAAISLLSICCSSANGQDSGNRTMPLRGLPMTVRASEADLLPTLPGIVEPVQHVIMTSPEGGLLTDVYVVEGAEVTHNQALAKLDTRTLQVDLRLAEAVASRTAAGRRAKDALKLANKTLARFEELRPSGAASAKQLDEAVTAVAFAKSNLAAANESAREAVIRRDTVKAAIEARTVRAAFNGTVLRIDAQPGQTVTVADPIVTIANLDRLQCEIHVPISRYDDLKIGELYQLVASAPINDSVDATLVSTQPVLNAGTGTFRCRFEFDNGQNNYPAGFAVRLVDPQSTSVARSKLTSEHSHLISGK